MIGYELFSTSFGQVGILWSQTTQGPRVQQVFLSKPYRTAELALREEYPHAHHSSSRTIAELGKQMQRFLLGQAITFLLDQVALELCGDFQRHVLLAEYAIPRGLVSTYGRIARHLGNPGASRAVGRALATNPFPIIIPCHRAVRSDGDLGGYQGGTAMKRTLLTMEGVEFTPQGQVCMDKVYYEMSGGAPRVASPRTT
jgi:methylated-DNA-[protein]-cysteine S-methyltransferase